MNLFRSGVGVGFNLMTVAMTERGSTVIRSLGVSGISVQTARSPGRPRLRRRHDREMD